MRGPWFPSLLRGQRPPRVTLEIFDQLAVRLSDPQHALALLDDKHERTFGNLLLFGERLNLREMPVAVLVLELHPRDHAAPRGPERDHARAPDELRFGHDVCLFARDHR